MNYRGGMWEGGGQDGVEWGGKWDNCNSIINKYIKKKEMVLETKIWALGVFVATVVSLLLGPLSLQNKEIYICVLTYGYSYIHTYFCMQPSISK